MFYNGILINEETLSIIFPTETGKYKLVVFDEKKPVYEKEYDTRTAAEIANTKMINKFDLLH